MDFGICLPNYTAGASPEGIEAAAAAAGRHGWSTVWTTDHTLIDRANVADYGRIYEAILTLAWVGARHPGLRLGTSVIVVPQRNAVLLAKELATLDSLSGGRVIAGVGVGWNEIEFGNLGESDRFAVRGAYLDETIRLWRHLWSGARTPFRGGFHTLEDFEFEPLPVQGAELPVVIGGHSNAALRRAATLADGYHSSSADPATFGRRASIVVTAAAEAGRPAPWLSARVRVRFGEEDDGSFALRGTPETMAAGIDAFAAAGATHIALQFGTTDAAEVATRAARFARDVAPLVG